MLLGRQLLLYFGIHLQILETSVPGFLGLTQGNERGSRLGLALLMQLVSGRPHRMTVLDTHHPTD
jgi:hypothetical protein